MPNDDRRRISAELLGDDAVRAEVMTTMLRIGQGGSGGMTKLQRDSEFVRLALAALERVIDETRAATGHAYPSAAQVQDFLYRVPVGAHSSEGLAPCGTRRLPLDPAQRERQQATPAPAAAPAPSESQPTQASGDAAGAADGGAA